MYRQLIYVFLWCICAACSSKELAKDTAALTPASVQTGIKPDAPEIDAPQIPAAASDKPDESSADKGEEEPLPSETDLPVSSFGEIWGYVMSGREEFLKAHYPISDIGYFAADINVYGELVEVPNPKKLSPFPGRIHLVVGCSGRALTHFVLIEGQVRKRLIDALLQAAKSFDGLQIDFESVPARDGDNFRSFLGELRKGLGSKLFTIALPSRLRPVQNDVYDYEKIKGMVDRILVMAYDEHWSTSKPGPIASMDWCKSVAAYSLKTIGPEKLIMGLPFYGRQWGNWTPNQAFIYSGIERIKKEQGITESRREKGIPTFTYQAPMTATVYYEDDYSLSTRMEMYRTMGVKSIGFWRVGQESPTIWSRIRLLKGE
jgi:spore germination protein YaaH